MQDESWTEKFGGTASIPCRDGYAYTSPVGTYQPNSFGLYDMLGNAFEWVEDCWSDDYAGASSDASIAMTLTGDCARLARGGSWNLSPLAVRSSLRFRDAIGRAGQIIGFRVALTLADQSLRPTH